MKELNFIEIKRDAEGYLWVGDRKLDWEKMTEVEATMYLGALWGSVVEHMRLEKKVCLITIDVKCKEGGAQ